MVHPAGLVIGQRRQLGQGGGFGFVQDGLGQGLEGAPPGPIQVGGVDEPLFALFAAIRETTATGPNEDGVVLAHEFKSSHLEAILWESILAFWLVHARPVP